MFGAGLRLTKDAPETVAALGGAPDALDEKFVELIGKGSIVGKAAEVGRSVDGGDAIAARAGVGAVVRAVTQMRAARGGGDIARAGVDDALVDGV